jgi:hypothetical protein
MKDHVLYKMYEIIQYIENDLLFFNSRNESYILAQVIVEIGTYLIRSYSYHIREYLPISSHRAVRKHEADYEPIRNYLSIIACMQNISNTEHDTESIQSFLTLLEKKLRRLL